MSYFTAVLAREGDKWSPRDVDVDDVEDLTDLADRLRLIENDDEPVLLLVEREDAWWAVVRVDGDEDPRVFLSDLAAPAHSPYAAFLEVADADAGDEDVSGTCGGDLDLLADLGTSADDLREMCEEEVIPMDAMAAVAEAGGFAEALDSLR